MSETRTERVRRHWREGRAVRGYVRGTKRRRKLTRLETRMLKAAQREAFWQRQYEELTQLGAHPEAAVARRMVLSAQAAARKLGYRKLKVGQGRISRPWWM